MIIRNGYLSTALCAVAFVRAMETEIKTAATLVPTVQLQCLLQGTQKKQYEIAWSQRESAKKSAAELCYVATSNTEHHVTAYRSVDNKVIVMATVSFVCTRWPESLFGTERVQESVISIFDVQKHCACQKRYKKHSDHACPANSKALRDLVAQVIAWAHEERYTTAYWDCRLHKQIARDNGFVSRGPICQKDFVYPALPVLSRR